MSTLLWTPLQLGVLSATAVFGLLIAAWARRRAPAVQTAAILVAITCALALSAHGLVWLLVRGNAAEFNDRRWVLLSPWGRIGQALGFGAGLGVIVLAWLGTRSFLSRTCLRRRSAIQTLATTSNSMT